MRWSPLAPHIGRDKEPPSGWEHGVKGVSPRAEVLSTGRETDRQTSSRAVETPPLTAETDLQPGRGAPPLTAETDLQPGRGAPLLPLRLTSNRTVELPLLPLRQTSSRAVEPPTLTAGSPLN